MAQSLRQEITKLATDNSELRKYLVPILRKVAIEFPNEEALKEYMKEHPDADPHNHSVKKEGPKEEPTRDPTKDPKDQKFIHPEALKKFEEDSLEEIQHHIKVQEDKGDTKRVKELKSALADIPKIIKALKKGDVYSAYRVVMKSQGGVQSYIPPPFKEYLKKYGPKSQKG